jgi:thiol-disulfide isomerase/thioredoxin
MKKNESNSRRRTTNRRLAIGFAALGVVLAGLILLTRNGSETTPEARAPDITLDYFNGERQQLGDLVGRPVVLNFWASWCPACVSEMPAFGDVHRQLGDRVEFIGVNTQEVDLDAANSLVEQTRVEYRLAHDPNGAIYREFGGVAMPTTVFITEDGEVARVHAGTITEADLVALIESELLG